MTPARQALSLGGGVLAIALISLFAIPPFYDWFCRVTGFAGTTGVGAAYTGTPDGTMSVRFAASTARDFPWEFRPVVRQVEVEMGETTLAFYEAHNPTDRPIAGSSSFNVTPYAAGGFFTKIDCFCFQEQILMPGETVRMPVSFYVDPAIATDREGRFVNEITLSYTFHEIDMPETAMGTAAARTN